MTDPSGETAASELPETHFAGFWRRIAAFLIDALILGAVGWIIGIVFYESLIQYGPFGRLIGLPIAWLYSGLLNSGIAGGGSPGKRALRIRVVARDGNTIGVSRSLWRAFVLELPLMLNGTNLTFLPGSGAWLTAVLAMDVFFVFGILLSSLYLYLANWRTRQVVHDLVAGTFVVRTVSVGRPVERLINPVHIVVVLAISAAALAFVPVAHQLNWAGGAFGADFDKLLKIQQSVNADPDVLSTGVNASTSTFVPYGGQAQVTTSLVVTIVYRGRPHDPEGFADRIAKRVLQIAPYNLARQRLVIAVRYGFDIGIASGWRGVTYSHSLDEWRARLRGQPAEGQSI